MNNISYEFPFWDERLQRAYKIHYGKRIYSEEKPREEPKIDVFCPFKNGAKRECIEKCTFRNGSKCALVSSKKPVLNDKGLCPFSGMVCHSKCVFRADNDCKLIRSIRT